MTPWDRVASIYDWQLPLERRAIAVAIELADPRPNDSLLDLATGTGAVLGELARRGTRPDVAIGVDTSERMLARAQPLPPGWGLERADASRLPFEDEQFDCVIACYVLHLLDPPTLGRTLGETARVLRPGGRAVTVTPAVPRSSLASLYELIAAGVARVSASSLGLRPMDPGPELARSGLMPVTGRYVRGGYPSLCVLARPAAR